MAKYICHLLSWAAAAIAGHQINQFLKGKLIKGMWRHKHINMENSFSSSPDECPLSKIIAASLPKKRIAGFSMKTSDLAHGEFAEGRIIWEYESKGLVTCTF